MLFLANVQTKSGISEAFSYFSDVSDAVSDDVSGRW